MSKSKYTPGPWHPVGDGNNFHISGDPIGDRAPWVAEIFGGLPPGMTEANARLIAAAPDLLEACLAFRAFEHHEVDCADCDEWGPGNCAEGHKLYSVACDSINEAIEKANELTS